MITTENRNERILKKIRHFTEHKIQEGPEACADYVRQIFEDVEAEMSAGAAHALGDAMLAEKISDLHLNDDSARAHQDADKLLLKELKALGYGETVQAFNALYRRYG